MWSLVEQLRRGFFKYMPSCEDVPASFLANKESGEAELGFFLYEGFE